MPSVPIFFGAPGGAGIHVLFQVAKLPQRAVIKI